MNRKIVFYTTGKIFKALAALLLLPALVALWYHERTLVHILVSAGIAYLSGMLLTHRKPEDTAIYAKEGFAIVALAWLGLSSIGALPLWLSGAIPSYIDALFETVSGFTTTGASIMPGVEHVSRALLFWRSFTHWVGGMGVLVFVMAIIPLSERRSMHIMRAEVPGPTSGKLLPRMRDTAKVLYTLYLGLSLLMFVLLIIAGMPAFDSAIHTFGTAGTGGFSSKNSSIAFYDSATIDWITTIFMTLFGVNFNLYYYLMIRNYKAVYKNEELRWYLGIMVFLSVVIAINIIPLKGSFLNALRYSAFQVSSLMTTTGYATANFDLWPSFSKTLLVLAMFIGASAGSTGGGLKVSRLMILGKAAKTEIKRMLHPRMVTSVTMDDKPVAESTITGAYVYIVVYFAISAVSVVLLSLDGFDFETNFTAMAACFNNIGPGLSKVGPICNYSEYSAFSKIVLILDMLLGRLEIFPMLFGLAFPFWKGHRKVSAKNVRTDNTIVGSKSSDKTRS
ncbi:MAG: TrkH family potassium uptake protein [Clostridia bacterium]|nr:TrkH family potassium uptake protein [Clostridia bacterium]